MICKIVIIGICVELSALFPTIIALERNPETSVISESASMHLSFFFQEQLVYYLRTFACRGSHS
ncbi:hypothetical protein P40081_22095 [Paenibacillus sp. FSL P4-0081]|nr:hypothetical protein P40081_22095 [Paenibacillus sp. FSL P4-0081]